MIVIVTILLLARVCSQLVIDCDNEQDKIEAYQWCDGSLDCSDGSDEKEDCCPAGFHMVKGECVDINECVGPLVCSQHCKNTYGSFVCSCDPGYNLTQNICKADGEDPIFLFSVENAVLSTTKDFTNFQRLPMSHERDSYHIYDFDYDHRNKLLFWCSGEREYYGSLYQNLWKATLQNGELLNPVKIISKIDCASLTVDWVNEKVYWVTKDSGKLIVASYDGYYHIILLWRNLDKLRSVAVSPSSGHIFWSDAGQDPHIGRANMDGSQQMFLLKKSEGDKINLPSAMTIDHNAGHLYWIDAFYKTLHVMDFNGDSYPLLENSPYLAFAWNMDIFEDTVYWVDSTLTSEGVMIRSSTKLTGKQYNEKALNLEAPIRGFRLYHEVLQPSYSNSCSGHPCQHFCLLTPTGPQCKCKAGYKLIGDGLQCIMSDNPCTVDSCDPQLCIKCGSGDCVLSSFKCDGEVDCIDGSDELECTSTSGAEENCDLEEFGCRDNLQCVRQDYKCDGKRDCNDGSDEDRCPEGSMCRLEDFACDDSTCLPRSKLCDSVFDCLDQTDELNCRREPECGPYQFACLMTHECIDTSLKCDGKADCDDETDEEECTAETPLCGEGKRKCSESVDQCIEEHQICNGASDCDNSEDEKYCHCKDPGFIPCGAGIDDDCIPEVQFCDGNKDCKNGSDEKKNCCPHGYTRSAGPLNMDGVPAPCEDVNECLRFDGACSQHCNNTEGGYICSCEDGYDLVDNTDKLLGRTHTLSFCRATGDGMKIISAVHLSVPITFEPKHAGGRSDSMSINGDYVPESLYMIDIDFDIQRKKIFWCARKNKIMQTYLNSIWAGDLTDNLNTIENSRVILKNINCDSIAVDWVNQLIYFTSDTGSILVSDYNGQYKRAIIWSGLKRPRAIEVDPEYGILFYTDWGDELPHLGRANMDGSDRQELINNTTTVMKQIAWPNAMTIDHPNKHIYWMDAKLHFLECMKYDGSSRYTVTSKNQGSDQNKLGFPWKLRVFEDKVYWLDMPNEKILSANKFTGNSITEEWNFDQRGASIRIYHPVVQPPYLPRCEPNLCNQGLCLPVPNGYRCACQIGHTLLLDNKTCTIRPEAFAYVVMQGMIMKVALEPLEPVPQPITFQNEAYEETTFWSVDYHETWVYFNEYSKFNSQISIKRMSLEGQMTEILYKVVVNEKSKGGLSVDWLNGKIYWASSDSVSVGELDGSVHTTLIQKDGFKFSDILVDPCNGYIYLAVSERGIFRSSMDGDNASFTQLVSHFSEDESALPQPKGLTLDRDTNSLFFANKNVLYQARLNGSPLTAVPIVKRRDNINAVDLWGRDKIIWAETRTSNSTTTSESNMDNFSRVMAIQKLGQSNELQLVRENIHTEIFGIKVHPKRDTTCQPLVRNPCVDHACSHMCLQSSTNKDHVKGYRCVCPTGYALKKGSQTECADEIAQYLVYNPDNGIQTVSLDTHFLTPIKEFPNMTFKVTTFDIDAKNNLVYYCYGTPNKFEVRGLFDETGDATVHLPIHTLKCSGMVVEWVTNKLYIVDMGKTDDSGLILVVNLEKPYLMKHIVTELRRPLNIVVHPQRGKIYWILESHNIMSTNMDGTTVIESIVSYPASQVLYNPMTQMFIDFAEDHLYWTENVDLSGVGTVGLIKKVNLATKIVVQVHETKLRLLSGATIINDLIYFSDNKKYMYRIDNSTDKTVETRLLSTGDISYIRSSQSQPSLISNPCERNNGGCSDFCLLDSSPPYRCSCPTGIQLNDAHTCDTPHNNSLIVANATRINIMSLSSVGPAIDRVLTSKPEKLRAIDVDILMNKIYWSEIHNDWGAIWMLDMKTGETERIVSEDILVPNSIAVDMNAQNIFWIDSSENGKGTLEVMSLRTRKRSILKRYEDTSGRPQQIVLDPYEMLLFVSYPVVVNDVITRMWMNGNNEFGIQGDNLPTLPKDYIVSCLAIDLIEKRLYWSTADEIDHIASCDYKGQKRKVYNGLPSGITAQAFTILNRNIFVHHNPYAKVTEFRDTMYDGQIKETKEYNFYHLRGAMVSMKVGSIRVRADSPVCRPNMCCDVNMCTEKICIPTEIMAQCRCADDDVVCRENTEKEVESVPNYLPDNPDLCPDNFCSGKGTCVQFILPGSTSNSSNYGNKEYGFRCACDEGFSEPRCAKKKDRIAAAPWLAILILVVIIVIVIAVLWCHPKLCRNIRADHLRGESSEIDDTEQGEMEAKKLEKLVNKGIGRSYLRPNNHEQPV